MVSLAELVKGFEQDPDQVDRWVAITFDDGYIDNLRNAKPLLEQYQARATVFVATGYVGKLRGFWWDQLERLFLQPSVLPSKLSLTFCDETREWELGEASRFSIVDRARHCDWNVTHQTDPTPRHRIYRELCAILRPLQGHVREAILEDLRAWANCEEFGWESHRALTRDEVRHLGSGGCVEVGAHSVSHDVLASLAAGAQQAEISGSRTQLEELLAKPVESFAYPYGTRSDYTSETTELVRGAGFRLACSNFPALVRSGTDIFQLPRFIVRDWDQQQFAKAVDGWFGR
jgi:peptidoglycan/xylan/chitin deacetylase (PgdA/CDA1 family)